MVTRTLALGMILALSGCKPANKDAAPTTPVVMNAPLAARLAAFGKDDSQANLEACLNTMRTALLFLAVKPGPSGEDQAALKVDKEGKQVVYAFLEQGPAAAWWRGVEGVSIKTATATSILDVAAFEQAHVLIIEPQSADQSLVIPRENFAPIAKAWGSVGADSGTLH